jgi:hypothetical protein
MKKLLIITAGVFYLSSVVSNVSAQKAMTVNNSIETSEPLMVKYLGVQDDYLVFRVEIKTGNINLSVFKVEDATEGELYSKDIYSNSKYTIMKIEKRENQVLDFKLLSQKKVYTKTFTTDSNNRLFQKGLAVL